jgi:hypothetical protein
MGLFGRLTIGNWLHFKPKKQLKRHFNVFKSAKWSELIDSLLRASVDETVPTERLKMEKFDSCKQIQQNKQGRKRFMPRRQVNFHLSNCSVLIFLSSWPSSSFLGCWPWYFFYFLKRKSSSFPLQSSGWPEAAEISTDTSTNFQRNWSHFDNDLELLVALWETGGQS